MLIAEAPPAPSELVMPHSMTPGPRIRQRILRWPLVMAGVAFCQYVIAGWWLIYVRHYQLGDATTKTLNAKLMVLSRDPHIGAVGFYWMPLPTVARIPFILLLDPFGQAVMGGVATTALFGALTIPVLAAIGRLLDAPTWLVVTVCALWGVSPVTMLMSANAMSESTFCFCVAVVLWAYTRWTKTHDVWDLALLGITLSLAASSRYEMLVMAPFIAAGAAVQLPRSRWFSSVALAMIPTLFWISAWALASKLIAGDWIFFLHASSALTTAPADAVWLPAHRTLVTSFVYCATIVAALSPGIIIGFAALRRNLRATVCVLAAALAYPAFVVYQVAKGISWATPRFFLVTTTFSFFLALWGASPPEPGPVGPDDHHRRPPARRRTESWVGAVAVLSLIGGVVAGTLYQADPIHTDPEGDYIFFRYILGRDSSTANIEGKPHQVFSADLGEYYTLRSELDPILAKGSRVATDVSNYLTLITDHPKQFVVPEDRDFDIVASDPIGRFNFVVVVKSSAASGRGQALLNDLRGVSPLGRWIKTRDYRNIELWEFVKAGEKPLSGPDAATSAPVGTAGTAATTTTASPSA